MASEATGMELAKHTGMELARHKSQESVAEVDPFEVEQSVVTKKLMSQFAKDKPGTVDRQDLVNFLAATKHQRDSFLKLPFTVLFFVFYVVAVLNHEHVTDSSMMQREFRGILSDMTYEGVQYTAGHKTLADMRTVDDWFTYMHDVVIPLFINPLNTPKEDLHRVLRYNQLIGGLQIQQVRRRKVPCSTQYPKLGPFPAGGQTNPILADFGCYPWTTESDDCYGPWNQTLRLNLPGGFCPDTKRNIELGLGLTRRLSGLLGGRRMDFVPQGGGSGGDTKGARQNPGPDQLFTVYLYEYEGQERALEKLQQLKNYKWIDFNTAWVGFRLLVLNPDLQIFLHISVSAYMATSGALLPHIRAQSFYPDPYQYMAVIALDAIWILLLLWLVFGLLKRLHHAARHKTCREFLEDTWIWLDAAMVLGGLVIIILWLVLLDKLVGVKKSAMEVRAREPSRGFTSDIYPGLVATLHEDMVSLSDYLMALRLCFCWYTILISLKFLESFSAQPRLAVVTRTIWAAGSELFHFMIVLLIVFFAYVIAGMFIFGRRLWEFSSFDRACAKCFLMMLGDFDWDALGDENPVTAAFWFWTFMIVMTLLLLNMLMAIIMDKYTQVKSDAAEHDTLFVQMKDMFMETVSSIAGKRVSVANILHHVKKMPQAEVTEEDLVDGIPKLSRDQARQLIEKTQDRVDDEVNKGVTMSEAMRMIGWLKIAVQKIGWQLEEILKDEREERRLLQGQESEIARIGATMRAADGERSEDFDREHHEKPPPYVADADERLERIESRMQKMEEFMQTALQYTTFRGKDLRNRLAVIEDLIRSQRDATMVTVERDVWDSGLPRLGGNEEIAAPRPLTFSG